MRQLDNKNTVNSPARIRAPTTGHTDSSHPACNWADLDVRAAYARSNRRNNTAHYWEERGVAWSEKQDRAEI